MPVEHTQIALTTSCSLPRILRKTAGAGALICASLGSLVAAQTTCALQHEAPGAYICYPNPVTNPEDSVINEFFHLSLQANAPGGRTIGRFRVLLDDHLVYENRAEPPVHSLSIETNLTSPFDSGIHTLQFAVDGVGTAEVKGLQIITQQNATFCDPIMRADRRTCIQSRRSALQWSIGQSVRSAAHPLDEYRAFLDQFGRNAKALEADESDAVAVDTAGNLYVASHAFSDVELRKYTPGGSIVYDTLIRSCGEGFQSVAALAVDDGGQAWIVGNTSACFRASPNALNKGDGHARGTRGIVVRVDTTKPSSLDPEYITYLSDVDYQITGIRVDGKGNAYLTGTTESLDYPHESLLGINEASAAPRTSSLSFVSVLNSSGSNLLWSALLRDTQLNALAIDAAGHVYLTGRAVISEADGKNGDAKTVTSNCDIQGAAASPCGEILVAEITDRGRQLPYVARFGGSRDEEGRAISVSSQGGLVFVTGDTDSPDFPASSNRSGAPRERQQSVMVALQPCRTGVFDVHFVPEASAVPPVVFPAALDAFASAFPERSGSSLPLASPRKLTLSIERAPSCASNR